MHKFGIEGDISSHKQTHTHTHAHKACPAVSLFAHLFLHHLFISLSTMLLFFFPPRRACTLLSLSTNLSLFFSFTPVSIDRDGSSTIRAAVSSDQVNTIISPVMTHRAGGGSLGMHSINNNKTPTNHHLRS